MIRGIFNALLQPALAVFSAASAGCFMFTFPGPATAEIGKARPGDGRYYHLRDDDGFCGMRIFLPEAPAARPRPAVVIFPGGAYGVLALAKEGGDVAEFFNRYGVVAVVVKYPLGSLFGHFRRHPAMLEAARRAVRLVRYNAKNLAVDPARIGVMGFSAGGHLAGLTALTPGPGDPGNADPAERVSARPDFVILGYPVVSMSAPCAHQLSRRNLLGGASAPETRRAVSLELLVTSDCPPVFVWTTGSDRTVDPENSRLLAAALVRGNVPCQLEFYPAGPHGMGLLSDRDARRYPEAARWPMEMLKFLRRQGFLDYSGELTR